ncbi:MAG TPA: class I SAM-dependent methyltransferase [Solirubrobacterales bacterium]|jgi:SAM-dependent methyltransferase|nr:class I SAM-dependent methyltransferase [Solirubrobacterales bacterium]
MNEPNRRVFDSVADTYVDLALKPAEQAVMTRLGDRLKEFEMLDIGVGAGRTGYTFAPLVRRYVGLDYSPRMLARAERLLGGRAGVELVLGDARDLSSVQGPFDLVLFSFNGIDAVGNEDRLKILAEVHRALKPGGYFLFSTHSLGTLPLSTKKARSPRFEDNPAYELFARLRDIRYGRRIRKVNAGIDLGAARERGWAVVEGFGHNFQLDDYYVDPGYQVQQLREHGFEVAAVYDTEGHEVDLPFQGRDPWLDYLCRPAAT